MAIDPISQSEFIIAAMTLYGAVTVTCWYVIIRLSRKK